jgi:hypothetical protein
MALHEILGESFGGFELCGFPVGTPDPEALGLKMIDDTCGEGIVRADDGKANSVFPGERGETVEIVDTEVDALDELAVGEALGSDAGVTWRAPDSFDAWRLRQFPNEGVFAPT